MSGGVARGGPMIQTKGSYLYSSSSSDSSSLDESYNEGQENPRMRGQAKVEEDDSSSLSSVNDHY